MKTVILFLLIPLAMLTSTVQASIILDPMDYLRSNSTSAQSLANTWQLGVIDTSSSAFSLLNTVQSRSRDGDTQYRWYDGDTSWFGAYFYGSETTAASSNWLNPSTGTALPADTLGMHTIDDDTQDLVLRYVATTAGIFNFDIIFQSNNSGTKTALIKNDDFDVVEIANIGGSDFVNLTGSMALDASDSVYIGFNSFNGWGSDAASIRFNSLTITPVSAPGAFAILAFGLALIRFYRVRES